MPQFYLCEAVQLTKLSTQKPEGVLFGIIMLKMDGYETLSIMKTVKN